MACVTAHLTNKATGTPALYLCVKCLNFHIHAYLRIQVSQGHHWKTAMSLYRFYPCIDISAIIYKEKTEINSQCAQFANKPRTALKLNQ